MKLKQVGSNMTELRLDDAEGFDAVHILFSYETPVAAWVCGQGFLRTSERYSQTTTRHINKWLDGRTADERPQAFFYDLVKGE